MSQSGSLHLAVALGETSAVVVAVPAAAGPRPFIIGTTPASGPVTAGFWARARAYCWCRLRT